MLVTQGVALELTLLEDRLLLPKTAPSGRGPHLGARGLDDLKKGPKLKSKPLNLRTIT